MNRLTTCISASLMLLAISCQNATESAQVQSLQLEDVAIVTDTGYQTGFNPPDQQTTKNNAGAAQTTNKANRDWEKKIIRNAELNVEVNKFETYNQQVHELVQQWEGYIAGEEQMDTDYKIESVLSIKVPVLHFEDAINQLSGLKGKILAKKISSQDVTTEILDTRARMEAKKRVRLRYLDMLHKAKNMEEILQIEREINGMQEQIEAAEGRISYVSHAAAYSTIKLVFFQVINPGAKEENEPGFSTRILKAFRDGTKLVGELLVAVISIWPLWLAIALIIWFITSFRKKIAIKNH